MFSPVLQNYNFTDLTLFNKLNSLGIGSTAQTFKIQEKSTGNFFAGKCFGVECSRKSYGLTSSQIEVLTYSKLSHPGLLKFYGFSSTDFEGDPNSVLILEYTPNSLETIVDDLRLDIHHDSWNNTKLLINLYGIANTMAYLHSNFIIHRDLEPRNILLDSQFYPKISEFGLSRFLDPNSDSHDLTYGVGSLRYMSPEMFEDDDESPILFPYKIDVYSYAIIAFQMLGQRHKFSLAKLSEGKRCEFTKPTPKCYQELIKRCWAQNPEERPSFQEIADMLSTNRDFITELGDVDETEFFNYVEMLNGKRPIIEFDQQLKQEIEYEVFEEEPLTFGLCVFDLQTLEKIKKIGEGAFGVVYEVKDKLSEELFSAKISKFEYYNSLKKNDNVVNFIREVTILNKLQHPAIMKFIGYSPLNFDKVMKPVIVTELLKNGSLDGVINAEQKGLSHQQWNETKKLIHLYGIAHALQYMHSHNILHRDLKSANILLDDHLYPKLCDFGLSKDYLTTNEDCQRMNPTELIGSPAFIAPEIFEFERYSKASDVYAYSILAYQLLTTKIPFEGMFINLIAKKVINKYRPEIPNFLPPCYKQLIEDCWQHVPENRPSFQNILDRLRNNPEFITENVDENEFLDYVEMLDNGTVPNTTYPIIHISIPTKEKLNIEGTSDLSQYSKQDKLGRDLYWKYYKFIDNKTNQEYVGQISNNLISNMSEQELSKFYDEVKILSRLKHPNLIAVQGYSFENFKSESKPIIINEFYKRQTLSNIIDMSRNNFIIENWTATAKLINLFGIASGMSYLHRNGVSHPELTPNSIIVDNNAHPKLTNYGFFMKLQISNSITQSASKFVNNPIYQAPEILRNEPAVPKSDVYSFGMIAYEIFVKDKPFQEFSRADKIINEIINKNARPKFPTDNENKIPECYQELIERCWCDDPSERPSFDEIIEILQTDHRFITSEVNELEYTNYIKVVNNFTNKTRITE